MAVLAEPIPVAVVRSIPAKNISILVNAVKITERVDSVAIVQ